MPKPTKKEESDRLAAVEERKVLIEILKETGQDLKKAILEKDRDEVTILLQQFILEKEKVDLRSRRIENLPAEVEERTEEIKKQSRVDRPFSRLKVQAEMFLDSTKATASTTTSSSTHENTTQGQECYKGAKMPELNLSIQ